MEVCVWCVCVEVCVVCVVYVEVCTLQLSASEDMVVENASISVRTVSCFFSKAFRGEVEKGRRVRGGRGKMTKGEEKGEGEKEEEGREKRRRRGGRKGGGGEGEKEEEGREKRRRREGEKEEGRECKKGVSTTCGSKKKDAMVTQTFHQLTSALSSSLP